MPRATAKSSTRLARKRVKTLASRPSMQAADELMELAVDAAHSRNLPAFLERFAQRAARMLDARWGGVMVFRGRETDLYQAGGDAAGVTRFAPGDLTGLGREIRADVETLAVSFRFAIGSLGRAAGDGDTHVAHVTFVPITASDEENLGCLCLIRGKGTPSAGERHLLVALASHAALSLENFRRFSQLERSKRQWVEDIDAISDYIVVHDRSFRIVRTNRSLASHLSVSSGGARWRSDEQLAADCWKRGASFPARFAAIRSRRARNTLSRRRSGIFLGFDVVDSRACRTMTRGRFTY